MVHADEHALDPGEEEYHDLPLALVPHHLSQGKRHSVSQRTQVKIKIRLGSIKRYQLYFCVTFLCVLVPARCLRSVPGSHPLLRRRRPLPHLPPSWQWRTTRTPPITAISSPPPTTNCNEQTDNRNQVGLSVAHGISDAIHNSTTSSSKAVHTILTCLYAAQIR